jgi:Tfp pilus assembly protein PilF
MALSVVSLGCATLHTSPVADNVVAARQLSLRGLDAMQQGQWDEAEKMFASAIDTNPADERAHHRYAELLWRREVRDQAIAHMEESVRLSGGDAERRAQLGRFYLERGDLERAWEQAEDAIRAHRQSASAWALRGDVLRRRGQANEAMVSYHRALGYQPVYPHVQLAVAELYAEQNRPRRSLATLESLDGQCGPSHTPAEVLLLKGLAFKALGRYDDAVDVLTLASQRGEPSVELLYHLSESHWLVGDIASAGLAVNAALARAPDHGPSCELRDRIQVRQRNMTARLEP